MYTIKKLNHISEAGRRALPEDQYLLAEEVADPDAILVRSTPLHDMVFGENLKAIFRVGAGTNTIPVERCTENGIAVFNTPGGNANAVKELTIAAIISVMRNVEAASAWVRSLGEEAEAGKAVEQGKETFRGPELMGKRIGILGVGAIGSRMARICDDFGMEVLGYDPYLPHLRRLELGQYLRFVDDVNELYESCDIVTVHIPLNEQNKKFVGREAIAKMKQGVYLINYARGGVVDNEAIVEALDAGKIKAYATDFPTVAQLSHPKVFCTPHLASGTPEAEENCAMMAVRQARDYLENGNVTNSVNFPDVSFARAEGDRITILHHNKVGMLGVITDRTAGMGLNIENLVNKARGEVAYTILDFNEAVPEALEKALSEIEGVIRVRVIH